jgi:hypothetical protein
MSVILSIPREEPLLLQARKDMGEEKGGKEDKVELMLGEIKLLPWASVGDLCVSKEVKVGAEADLSSELVGVHCFSFLFLSLWD